MLTQARADSHKAIATVLLPPARICPSLVAPPSPSSAGVSPTSPSSASSSSPTQAAPPSHRLPAAGAGTPLASESSLPSSLSASSALLQAALPAAPTRLLSRVDAESLCKTSISHVLKVFVDTKLTTSGAVKVWARGDPATFVATEKSSKVPSWGSVLTSQNFSNVVLLFDFVFANTTFANDLKRLVKADPGAQCSDGDRNTWKADVAATVATWELSVMAAANAAKKAKHVSDKNLAGLEDKKSDGGKDSKDKKRKRKASPFKPAHNSVTSVWKILGANPPPLLFGATLVSASFFLPNSSKKSKSAAPSSSSST